MIDPNAAARELDRAVTKLQCRGALINGTTNGLFLDHPSFASVLEAAQALDVPIYLHPAPPPPAVQDAYFGGLPEPYGMLLSIAGWGWHTEITWARICHSRSPAPMACYRGCQDQRIFHGPPVSVRPLGRWR
jgi:hypothetical protein